MGPPARANHAQHTVSRPHRGAPPKVAAGPPARARHAQYSASWPHTDHCCKSQRGNQHAPATPSAALRGPIGRPTKDANGTTHARPPHPAPRFVAPSGATLKVTA
eukprot:1160102-Pyramimonas_sp.AAC.1